MHGHVLLQPLLDEVNILTDSWTGTDCQTVIGSADYIYEKVVNGLRLSAQKFIPRRKGNFYKFWWSTELDILKDDAIEYGRMWKNTGQSRSGSIHAQYQKRNYYIKSVFENSKWLRPVILPVTYMQPFAQVKTIILENLERQVP